MARWAGLGIAVLAFVTCAVSSAASRASEVAPLIIEHADNRYDVQTDGSYVQTYHFEFEPTNDASARREAQQSIPYSPALEDLRVVEAFTRKPDGRVIHVDPSAIRDVLPWSTPDLALFGDQRQKVIVFPEVAGGDTLAYTWRRIVKHPIFPGQFMTSIYMSRANPWRSLDLTISAPAAMALHTEAHCMSQEQQTSGDRIVYHWHRSAPEADGRSAAVGPYDRLPRVFVSSFANYDAFARAYAGLVADKAAPTPRLRALADELTEGVTDRREQARLLYEYVSLHVRYVAVYLSNGALEPRFAEQVLADGYGDCKDHTVLFDALLAAKGIDAEFVMINLGAHYTLSGPPTLAQLNHAITYIPEFGVYADTTAGTAPFGTLQFEEYGKPVVHAVVVGEALRRTPVLEPGAATLELRTTTRIEDDGSIVGETVTTALGPFSADLRRSALWAEANGASGAAAMQLRSLGTEGAGDFAFAPPSDLEQSYRISGRFTLDPRPEILDGDSFAPPIGLRVLVRPGDLLLGPLAMPKLADDQPTPCYAGRQIEDV
ncbi:MAG TPA: DUF3857 and transglutaminase domain-containing protein, partial [Acetobacteraceae bacterium]|nr:DUF3857 and transglutaminase domain-containing protein [Acetobacteraceae bacterium]